ncbi:hypothetical protein [Flavobacterium ginsenosidimutans]|uniref:hypothetical protein n=1 Tax=Flavobacterium ginsenosidimutans TaxID=687844 RepID=UPI0013A62091|nr:hypothetical protein [Flavobacterium ginsenosidimutans]KAF2328092.1 hypothetical protein DM444_20065 [Flavobacterium ginsenosidimutans]
MSNIIDHNMHHNETLKYLFFHELHHYLQGIAYPYLYYLTCIEMKTLFLAHHQINTHKEEIDISDSKFIRVEQSYYTNLSYQLYNYRFEWKGDKLTIDNNEINPEADENVFCTNDLVENSTSIFHYKIIYGENASAEGYWKWLRNPANKSYKNLFLFLSNRLGYEMIYEFLPVISLLSFYTTEPLHALCTLFNKVEYFGDDSLNYPKKGRIILSMTYQHLDFGFSDYTFITDTPVGFITDEQIKKFLDETETFHLHSPSKQFFEEREIYEDALLNPSKNKNFDLLAKNFRPIAIHYNFTDFQTRHTAFHYNIPADVDRNNVELEIAEMAKIKDTVLSLTSRFNTVLPRTCHHGNCTYFKLNLCHRWNAIPKDYNFCSFPSWFALNFNKEIDPIKERLLPLSEKRREVFLQKENDYTDFLQNKKRWDYFHDLTSQTYILNISREIVQRGDIGYAISFIKMLSENKGLHSANNCLSFCMADYLDTEEELFCIDEVVEWCKELKSSMPELFYYINFKSRENDFLQFIFLEHTYKRLPGKYEVTLANGAWEKFIDSEFKIFEIFCSSHQMNYLYYFKKTFSPLI